MAVARFQADLGRISKGLEAADGGKSPGAAAEDLAREALRYKQRWDDLASCEPIATEVSDGLFDMGNSVLQNEARYRAVLRAFLALGTRSEIPELDRKVDRILTGPLTAAYELYEYWCLFKLDEVLRMLVCADQGASLPDSDLKVRARTKQEPGHSGADLPDNTISASYRVEAGGIAGQSGRIGLYYEYSSSKSDILDSYSVGLRPDYTIVWKPDGGSERMLILDAKYRFDASQMSNDDGSVELEERKGTFQRGDLYKMHTYRDALYRGKCRPEWAIALYPGKPGKVDLYPQDRQEGEPLCNGHRVVDAPETGALAWFLRNWLSMGEAASGRVQGGVGAISLLPAPWEPDSRSPGELNS